MEEESAPPQKIQHIDTRPKALNRLMLAPISIALLLVIATGTLVWKMTQERDATGQRVSLSLQGECLATAKDVILKRAEAVGVGEPLFKETPDGALLTLTLPDIPNAEVEIPTLLLRRGLWTMKADDEVILNSSDISSASLSLDESGMPETLLAFDPVSTKTAQAYLDAHPDGETILWLDDEKIITRPNTIQISDEFRLVSTNTEPKLRMKESADFVILLSHPTIGCSVDWKINTGT
jgi:hypothetical protein